MIMTLKTDGWGYLINALIFVVLLYTKPLQIDLFVGALIFFLLLFYLLYPKLVYSKNNTWRLGGYKGGNIWGVILALLFLENLLLHWSSFSFWIILYVVLFFVIQVWTACNMEEQT